MYSTFNEGKAVVIERFNKTLKNKMFKYFTTNGTYRYINILSSLVNEYNNKKHSSTKLSPNELYKLSEGEAKNSKKTKKKYGKKSSITNFLRF